MALYQKWPGRNNVKYGIVTVAEPTLTISVFSADMAGLARAIEATERTDAKLIRLPLRFYSDNLLKSYVEGQIKRKIYVDVYKVTSTIPQEVRNED